MRAFDIGQMVWVHKEDIVLRSLNLGFFATEIREIITSENKDGTRTRYLLSNGDNKSEGELFPSKEDAIDHIIDLLEEEKERE